MGPSVLELLLSWLVLLFVLLVFLVPLESLRVVLDPDGNDEDDDDEDEDDDEDVSHNCGSASTTVTEFPAQEVVNIVVSMTTNTKNFGTTNSILVILMVFLVLANGASRFLR